MKSPFYITLFNPSEFSHQREDWNQASHMLRLYLDSLEIGDEFHLQFLHAKILEKAILHEQNISKSPTELTWEVARQFLGEWFGSVLKPEFPMSVDSLFTAGFLAWKTYPFKEQYFCHVGAPLLVDPELQEKLREAAYLDVPELEISSMTARPIDYGLFVDLKNDNTMGWRPVFKIVLFWVALYLLGVWGWRYLW